MKIITTYNQFILEKLQRIVTKSSSSGRTKEVQSIHDHPKDAKSRSAYVLLAKKLRDQEFMDLINTMSDSEFSKGGIDSKIHMKLRVALNNLKFLKDTKSQLGELYCEYCPKGPLVIYDIDVKNISPEKIKMRDFRFSKFDKKDGATADHKIPQSRGGDKFSYSNLAVCCYQCNQKKRDMPWEDWLEYLKRKNQDKQISE